MKIVGPRSSSADHGGVGDKSKSPARTLAANCASASMSMPWSDLCSHRYLVPAEHRVPCASDRERAIHRAQRLLYSKTACRLLPEDRMRRARHRASPGIQRLSKLHALELPGRKGSAFGLLRPALREQLLRELDGGLLARLTPDLAVRSLSNMQHAVRPEQPSASSARFSGRFCADASTPAGPSAGSA